jgi:hypothetical protein
MASGFGRFGRTDGFGIFGTNSRVMSEEELVDARFRLMIVCRGSASRIQFRIFLTKDRVLLTSSIAEKRSRANRPWVQAGDDGKAFCLREPGSSSAFVLALALWSWLMYVKASIYFSNSKFSLLHSNLKDACQRTDFLREFHTWSVLLRASPSSELVSRFQLGPRLRPI